MRRESVLIRNLGINESWMLPEAVDYTDESHLEEILAEQLERIPNIEIGSRGVRQLQTTSGPIDLCVITPSGRITVVECKLKKNSEHRRRIVGQAIDYAASVHAGGFENFAANWASKSGESLDDFLSAEALAILKKNISDGSIDLCLVVDSLDDELRQLVEYLNTSTRSDVSVTALELAYVRHGEIEILIPTTFGVEIAQSKEGVRSRTKESWTWESFVSELADANDKELANELARRLTLVEKTGRYDQMWFGIRPGGSIYFQISGNWYSPFYLWQNSAHELQVFGTWRVWSATRNDERYSELAKFLGQSHLDGSKGVRLSKLDIDEFWRIAVECDQALNRSM